MNYIGRKELFIWEIVINKLNCDNTRKPKMYFMLEWSEFVIASVNTNLNQNIDSICLFVNTKYLEYSNIYESKKIIILVLK